MSGTLNVLIVHGIGWGESKDYARQLQTNICDQFERTLRRLRLRDVSRRAASPRRALHFEAAYWAPVTQDPQDALIDLLGLKGLWPFRKLSLTYQSRKQMVALLGDVIAYGGGEANRVYKAIHGRVDDSVSALTEASEFGADGRGQLTIIGHSLGSVIASDYVWDHTRGAGAPYHLADHRLAIKNMVLLGSPMALYALRNNPGVGKERLAQSLDSPVQVDPDGGLWLNLYDPQDPIAFPLRPIKSYESVGVIDCPVRAGNWLTSWSPASHVGYWHSAEVAAIVGRKLALDWAGLNSPAFAGARYTKAVTALRKDLCQRSG